MNESNFQGANRITPFAKTLYIIPILILILGFWSFAYVEGYYIEVKGTLLYSFPLDQPFTLILDSTIPGEFHTILEENPSSDWLVLEPKGELPEGFEVYSDGKYITVEGPMPSDYEINIAWTPQHLFFRSINVSTNEVASLFGVYPKNMMESLGEILLYISAATLAVEFILYRYNKRKNLPTVITYYKIQILIIKTKLFSRKKN